MIRLGLNRDQFFARLILIVFIVCIQIQLSGQDELDSLLQLADNEIIDDGERSIALSILSYRYSRFDIDSSKYFAERGFELASNANYELGMAKNYLYLGRYQDVMSNNDSALVLLEKALKQYEDYPKDKDFFRILLSLGIINESRQNYDLSLKYNLMGLMETEHQNDTLGVAFFSNNVAIVYEALEDYEKSLLYSMKAARIFKEWGRDYNLANLYGNIASLFNSMTQNDSALYYFQEAEKLNIKLENNYGLANLYNNWGDLYFELGSYDTALIYFLKSFEYGQSLDPEMRDRAFILSYSAKDAARVYLINGDYSKAISLFKYSLEQGKILNSTHMLKEANFGLYSCYESLSNYDSAFYYHKAYAIANDSMASEVNNRKIAELNFRHELAKEKDLMDKERELLLADRKNQRLSFFIIISGLVTILLVLIFIGYYQKSRLDQSRLRQKNLELEKNQLQLDLDYKNKELTTSVLHLIERNEFINQLSEKLQSTEENLEAETILDLVKEIERNTSGNLWEEFEKTYMEVHKDFHIALTSRYPQLTANDRKLCAFILMNMSSKEISSITYQSTQSIKVARYRLRKKLGLQRSDNLSAFLNQLESGFQPNV